MRYLNAPVGYPIAEKIEDTETGRLKSFLINTTADEEMQEIVRNATHDEVIKMLTDSGFTFDADFLGYREIPQVNGRMQSRLDDPEYRRRLGIVDQ